MNTGILNDDLGQSETRRVEIQASLYDNYDINWQIAPAIFP